MSVKKAEGNSSFLEFLGVGLLTSLLLDYFIVSARFPENVTPYLHESVSLLFIHSDSDFMLVHPCHFTFNQASVIHAFKQQKHMHFQQLSWLYRL